MMRVLAFAAFALAAIVSLGAGCNALKDDEQVDMPAMKTTPTVKVLSDRLAKKEVWIAPSGKNYPEFPPGLFIRFDGAANRFQLNDQPFGSYSELATKLKDVRRTREEKKIKLDGFDEVDARIYLLAEPELLDSYLKSGITVEDFEKLVDDLHRDGFKRIEINFEKPKIYRAGHAPGQIETDPDLKNANLATSINGDIVNDRAVNLVQPEYPVAASAVRAEGTVKVQVVIDSRGNVISAEAVSGHPLLRDAAVKAALGSTFKPTLLADKPVKSTGIIVYEFKQNKRIQK